MAGLRRWVDPEEVADAALFSASDTNSGVTGERMKVDAGVISNRKNGDCREHHLFTRNTKSTYSLTGVAPEVSRETWLASAVLAT